MYNIKLDENKFYTGSYAKIGKVQGGIDLPSLPPTEDSQKALCYKYDYHDVIKITQEPKTEEVITIDEETQEEITTIEFVLDEEGEQVYIEVETTTSVLGWVFDEGKYQEAVVKKLEGIKQSKLEELSRACNEAIIEGVTITTSKGEEHFSLTYDDQINIQDRFLEIMSGATETYYHADGDGDNCRLFSADEITTLSMAARDHKFYHTTYYNTIKAWVLRCEGLQELDSMFYGITLPEDLDESLRLKTGRSSGNEIKQEDIT